MARPVFLSYSWRDPYLAELDQLDELLRLRGVPVWRDRRAMGFGDYLEDEIKLALREDCSGFALYLTEPALFEGSGVIPGIELPEMDGRRGKDSTFFAGAVFRDYDFADGQQAVQDACGISIGGALGERVDDAKPLRPQLTRAANAILARYLRAERVAGHVEVRIETRGDIGWREPGLVHLAWSPPLHHALDHYDDACWAEALLPALSDLRSALEAEPGDRALRVRGRAHLSAALALGYEFRQPTGWQLEVHDVNGGVWSTEPADPDLPGWRAETVTGPLAARELVVSVHASRDIARAARQHRTGGTAARAFLNLWPVEGPGTLSIDPQSANSLAAGIAGEIQSARHEYGAAEAHLYLACPWPFAALLGWHLASSGPIVSHEATEDRSTYVRACRLT